MLDELQSNTILKIQTEISIMDTIYECQDGIRVLDYWMYNNLQESLTNLARGYYYLANTCADVAIAENVHPSERTRSMLLDCFGAELLLKKLQLVEDLPVR